MAVPPTGRSLTLRAGDAEAVVVEVGAGLRSYRVDGRELVDGHRADEPADDYRGVVLAPWPNRLRDGRYSWDGVDHQVALTEPATATALHGFVTHVAWRPAAEATDRVELTHVLHAQPGYPFVLGLTVTYRLTPEGLTVRTRADNLGAGALPYGQGSHPYLSAGPGTLVDALHLVAPGATYLRTDDRGLPTGSAPVAGTPYDLRAGRTIGDLVLDHTFTDLERDERGRAWVRLTGRDGRGCAVWTGEGYRYLQLFTADTVSPDRRRRSLAVEPMTCPPNALATGEGVRRLEPGESVSGEWGIVPIG